MERSLLIQRIFKPPVGSILYHYCSANAFEAIINSGRIRFSDANMMNDAHELRWGYQIFEQAAGELMKLSETKAILSGLTKDFFEQVDRIISPLQLFIHPLIASFSREPDLLGQWRAYADDGCGFSIGFDAHALKDMPVTLLGIEYEHRRQIEEMKEALGAIYLENLDDSNRFGSKFHQSCMLLGSLLSGFKNSTFRDEREVRSLHVLKDRSDRRNGAFPD